MQFKISENSLFAHLLRSPWWISLAISLALIVVAHFVLPVAWAIYGYSVTLPFIVITVMAAWKQRDVPSAARVEATVEAVRAMSWRDFSQLVEQALQRDGYLVTRSTGAADFTLVKARRTVLVCARRWKAATHGIEPLRELYTLRRAQEANEAIYIALGDLSDNARHYASEHRITLMQGPELTRLLRLPRSRSAASLRE